MSDRRPPVYLDAHSTTPLDPRVLAAMLPSLREHFGNPSSATHSFGWYAAELVQIAREDVAALIGADPEEIIFTSGATESTNLVVTGLLRRLRREHPGVPVHVVASAIEHRAVLDPVLELKKDGVDVTLVPVTSEGVVDAEPFRAALRKDTVLACVMLANNEIGTVQPIAELAAIARAAGVPFLCDATQAPGRITVSVGDLQVDYLALSAHKMYGPKGAGALYVRRGAPPFEPLVTGGGQERGLRSGTLNVPAIVGFGAASRLAQTERAEDAARMSHLAELLVERLRDACPKLTLNGVPLRGSESALRRLPGNVHICFHGIDGVSLLGSVGSKVALSLTSACQSGSKHPSHVLQAMGLPEVQQRSSVRFGLSRMTSEDDIEYAAGVIARAIRAMSGGTPLEGEV